MNAKKNGCTESVVISFLAENVTSACDIVCAESGKCFVYCGNAVSAVRGNTRLIIKALLCLLSNAYLYGRESLVTVKTVEANGYIKIEVGSGGAFCFDGRGNGLKFVSEVCALHGGHFLIKSQSLSSSAIMIFPRSDSPERASRCPDFLELISDRLSPVYVEFFGMG